MSQGGNRFVVYTDGSSMKGGGGWGVVIVGTSPRTLSGSVRKTTNNRMELTAAIRGLRALPAGSDVLLYSDSEYVVKSLSEKRLSKWITDCILSTRINSDLWWELIQELVRHKEVEFRWVRGHAGDTYNELADHYATTAAKRA